MTVKELMEELKNYPEDMLIIADGADCGGYDVISGTNVVVLPGRMFDSSDCEIYGLRVYHEEYFYQK